ncbi:MAG: type I-E CRISPR-associated protein Cas5/CasD [Candidatus Endonucleobacter sp. (ex Gigantidas childressi)]|nr:type I-E CRISPR-associated protein Cas5/CasD [Candidatus Endonucleobacter sp. (ex Gigantidas childressi)]
MHYLVFRLYGPLASWGEIAVGESRHTAVYPGKSALVGLLGAALGIKRDDDKAQPLLTDGYRFAVKLLSSGHLLKDYHTVQAPDSVGKFKYRTRRDALVQGKDRLGTILSSREYRTDAQAVVAVASTGAPQWSLEQLLQALKTPKFYLYLGRKSCPLAAPLNAQIIEADNFRMALNDYQPGALLIDQPQWHQDDRFLPKDAICRYFWEGAVTDFSAESDGFDASQVQQLTRHDQPLSRPRWQFQPRLENHWMIDNKGGD